MLRNFEFAGVFDLGRSELIHNFEIAMNLFRGDFGFHADAKHGVVLGDFGGIVVSYENLFELVFVDRLSVDTDVFPIECDGEGVYVTLGFLYRFEIDCLDFLITVSHADEKWVSPIELQESFTICKIP